MLVAWASLSWVPGHPPALETRFHGPSAQGPTSPKPPSLQPALGFSSFPHAPLQPVVSGAAHQPQGRGPLIRPMNKSQRLLKRRAVLSAIIKWRVSAEEGAIKTVWEEGKVREGASEGLTLQLGLKGRQTMAWRAASSRASCPGRQSRLCSRSHGPDGRRDRAGGDGSTGSPRT